MYSLLSHTILFFILLSNLSALGQKDQYFRLYYEFEEEKYYLSAVDGGGDEVVAKRGKPGEHEKFHLQYIRKRDSLTTVYRFRTANNFFLNICEDQQLMAEEKGFHENQLFAVRQQLTQSTVDKDNLNITKTRQWNMTISWEVDHRYQLAFMPEEEIIRWIRFPEFGRTQIKGEEISIEILAIQSDDRKNREYTYRLQFRDADSVSMNCLYKCHVFVYDQFEKAQFYPLYQGQRELRFRLRGEPKHIHIQYEGDYGTTCPLPHLLLLKEDNIFQSWQVDEYLRVRQQIRLMMDGQIRKFY